MKAIHALIVPAAALMLGACSINIDGEGVGTHGYNDGTDLTVTLPSGQRDGFNCPKGTDAFVIDKTDQGKGLVYGCRTADADLSDISR